MLLVRPFVRRCVLQKCRASFIRKSYSHKAAKVRIGPEKFEIAIDVHSYAQHEIKVKAQKDYVLIEGKQEREIKDGYVIRQFAHKFKLPKGCSPDKMQSTLSPEGILTIAANREYIDPSLPCETLIPVRLSEGSPEEAISRKSKRYIDPCVAYKKIKVKPRCPGQPVKSTESTNPKKASSDKKT